MSYRLSADSQYKKWVVELKSKIGAAQIKAAMTVNRQLLELYWQLGSDIYEKQQKSNWGDGLIEQLSKDLSTAFPNMKGFSRANLFFIKKWYLFYKDHEIVEQVVRQLPEKVKQVVAQIPWGHNILIINKCPTISEALFYVRETIKNNWSRAILAVQIESKLYQRSGKTINNFDVTLAGPQADLAKETLKNPYNFDFLMLGKDARERDLEQALIDHIQNFILELGQGFAFLGKQYPLHVGGDDFYLDLLFYHTRLRCYVIIELKATEFKPEYAGKLNFYLNVVNRQLKHVQDQPSIGILLCKTPSKIIVEYSLENIAGPLGIAEYQIMQCVPEDLKGELPSIEELEEELGDYASKDPKMGKTKVARG
ncbi:MAG TPA: PDDEXK nuclease domain-containing protein [Puia sp.]|nr:PDDEXK nuclease domain-containing protein [Puia sp.]